MRCRSIPCGIATTLFAVLAGIGGGSCDPYGTYNDPDEKLGIVDPVLFPPANVGTGGDRKRPGRGRFAELTAYVNDMPVGYFSYALPTGLPTGSDPLRVLQEGKLYDPVPAPPAYVFDGNADTDDRYPCTPPRNYQFSPRRDDVDYSKQGPIFSRLPEATYTEGALPVTRYVPVVAEAGMGSTGLGCQQLKSTTRIKEVMGTMPPTTGKFLAWLMIDPAAPVYPREVALPPLPNPVPTDIHPGVGLQRWGWYNRYLVAFLDGGYIPTEEVMVPGPTIDMPTMITVTRMKAQRLFVPRQIRMGAMGMAAGRAGAGYDVLEFKRGNNGYSPLCQVWEYGDTTMPPPAVAELPKRADVILNTPGLNPVAATPASFVFCLQVR
jgi:hypothetical protein